MKFEASKELSQYFKEIELTSQSLTKQEELDIIPLAKAGDKQAINRVVNSCSKMVVKTANKFMGQGVEVIDLVQEGNMGTLEALRRFNPGKTRFSSYAQLWIHKYINDSVATVGKIVRLPMNKEFEIFKLKKAGKDVEGQTKVSLDKKLSPDSETTIGDMISITQPEIESQHHDEYVSELLDNLLSKIKIDRDREILKAKFGIGRFCEMKTEHIASEFGVTKANVSQIVNNAIKKMRTHL